MTIRFTVLASGSAGNASLVQVDGFGLLLDAGLGPRQLAARLEAVGATWHDIHAVLLTHTHGDHWHERTFKHLGRRGIRLFCHADHQPTLEAESKHFDGLRTSGLVETFAVDRPLPLGPGLVAHAVALSHDASATFGFRLELLDESENCVAVLAYAADLGCWTPEVVRLLADADILALEFNHDVALQHASGRSFHLIRRILGDRGHLSNAQAAALLHAVLRRSARGRLQHVVLLHLSRDCNRPELAVEAARAVLAGHDVAVHAACQDKPLSTISTDNLCRRPSLVRHRELVSTAGTTGWLPGMEP